MREGIRNCISPPNLEVPLPIRTTHDVGSLGISHGDGIYPIDISCPCSPTKPRRLSGIRESSNPNKVQYPKVFINPCAAEIQNPPNDVVSHIKFRTNSWHTPWAQSASCRCRPGARPSCRQPNGSGRGSVEATGQAQTRGSGEPSMWH